MKYDHEVLIVGGSHAGLSAAMGLGRVLRTALVVDNEAPRNKVSQHANNLISQDGIKPDVWRELARKDLDKYKTIQFLNASVTSAKRVGAYFQAHFSTGETKTFRKIILAFGVKDNFPSIAGFKELWGSSIFHCPFCHGYEFRNKPLALVGSGKYVEHMLPMALGLTKDIQVFTNGDTEIEAALLAMVKKQKIPLITGRITALNYEADSLKSLVVDEKATYECDGILLGPVAAVELKSDLGDQLGCEKNEMGFIKIIEMSKTSVDGVFAAGDITSPMHSVINAVATGQLAGVRAAAEILNEDVSVA